MIKLPSLFAACLLATTVGTLLAQSPATSPAVASSPPAAAATPLAADDLDTLRAHLSQTVDVLGVPTGTGRSKTGTVVYLNFGPAHKALAVVAFLGSGAADPAAHKVQSEDDLKPFVGKSVILHGKLADYKGDLQIVLDSLDQIKLAP